MRKSHEIAADLNARMASLQAETDAAKREALAAEVESLTNELREAQVEEAAQRALLNQRTLSPEEKKELKRFSLTKFIREAAAGKLSGFEAEMNEEAAKEMRASGQSLAGVGIPSVLLGLRTFDNNNITTATEGKEFAAITEWSYIEALRNAMLGARLGVRYIPGMQGNARIVKGGGVSASWLAEEAAASKVKDTFSTVDMTPHRLQILGGYTYDLLKQAALPVEQILWDELIRAHAQALDDAIFNGSGSSGQPLGILANTGIGDVAGGTNGAAISWANIVALESTVGAANGLFGRLAYVTNSKVSGAMKSTPQVAGFPRYMMEDGRANGFAVEVSNAIPSDLTKGTGTALSAMIFGNFEEVFVPQWGGLDMIVDPYSSKAKGVVEVTALAYHDVCVRRPACFAAIKDIKA
ncbi:MAG: phage major capsid protein [Bacteroidales bacterium]|nr:phage major capsid protein [Bacteroidales bacterium]